MGQSINRRSRKTHIDKITFDDGTFITVCITEIRENILNDIPHGNFNFTEEKCIKSVF